MSTLLNCPYCDKQITISDSRARRTPNVCCSKDCADKLKTKQKTIHCLQCNSPFLRKISEIGPKNFCSVECGYAYRKDQDVEQKEINKFVKQAWTNLNIRAGKYRHLSNKNKNKCYESCIVEFSRSEFREWCVTNFTLIKSSIRPSIDRIDSNGNYSLANIQIIELVKNVQNKRMGNRYFNGPLSGIERGVTETDSGRFKARISINRKEIHLGTFDFKEDALKAFAKKYRERYGKEPF
jgi:hypothetical protein